MLTKDGLGRSAGHPSGNRGAPAGCNRKQPDALQVTRQALRRFAGESWRYEDREKLADAIRALSERLGKVQRLGGPFARIAFSPHVAGLQEQLRRSGLHGQVIK